MAEKWHDINAPGVWQKPNKDAAQSGTTQTADATEVLQKGDYDENGAAAYNKDQSGDNFKPNNVVKKLQGDLITTNFLPKGSDDGFFGDQTDKAVKDFQDYTIKLVRMKRSAGKTENTDTGLNQQSPDGIVGEKTRDELDKWLGSDWIKPVPTLRHGE